jgi:hypothetical protein
MAVKSCDLLPDTALEHAGCRAAPARTDKRFFMQNRRLMPSAQGWLASETEDAEARHVPCTY